MKNKHWIELLVLLLIIANSTLGQQLKSESTGESQASWLASLKNSRSLKPFYSEGSGLMLNDKLFIGLKEINKQLSALTEDVGELTNYKLLEVYQLRDNEKFVLGTYGTSKEITLSTIIGWKNKGKWTKEFEVIYRNADYSHPGKKLVDEGRERWERHSNSHRPDLIVKEVFSENGQYFNRGKLYKGKTIADAYSYMNNASYKIKLESLKALQVSSDIIYDIGTFEVGGKGLYTLIWKKELDTWKLLLDFNF